MQIVVDTNVFVSGIFWTGIPHRILDLWIHDRFEIVASTSILNEYIRVITEIGNKKPDLVKKWIDFVLSNINIAEIQLKLELSPTETTINFSNVQLLSELNTSLLATMISFRSVMFRESQF